MEKKEKEISKPKRVISRLVGNVFCVEIEGLHKRYFQYIGSDPCYLGGDIVRVFKKRYPMDYEPVIDDIVSGEVDFYRDLILHLGVLEKYWYKVGRSKNIGDLNNIFFIDVDIEAKGYTERCSIRKAFVPGMFFIGKLPVKYQVFENSCVNSPTAIYNQLKDGYDTVLTFPKFLKGKSSEVKLEYTKKAGIDEMKGYGFILPKDNMKPIKFRESLLKPGIGVANEGLRGFESKEAYMYCCKVTALLEEKKSSGLPTDDEMAVLRKFVDILDYVVKGPDLDRPDGLFAGYMISSGRMESVWMVSRPDIVAKRLNAYISSERYLRNFESRIEEDPQWNTVNRMLDRID